MGLSAQAWVAIVLAAWLVTALFGGILLGKMIKRGRQLDREHSERVLAENRLRQANERLEVARREPASALPYSGPRGAHHADTSVDLPAVRADPGEAAVTGPMPQVPGAWTEEIHPGRRAEDRGMPPGPPRPPASGGRRRSDTRQTRAIARRLRDGDPDDDDTTTD